MRNGVAKSSRVLLSLAGIGILSIIIGLLYFSGVASWAEGDPASPSGFIINRLFFGFDYRILFAFGFFLLVIGLFPVLSAADATVTNSIKKISVHLLLLFGTGILLLFYSVFIYLDRLVVFDPFHTWFDYFILAGFAIVFSTSILLLSVKNSERLWNLKFLFAIFFLIGFFGILLSMIVYGGYIDLGDMISWDFIFILSGIFLFLGVIPMAKTAGTGFRNFLYKMKYLWLLLALLGILILILGGLINLEILSSSMLLDIDWFIFYLFGGLLLSISLIFLASAIDLQETINKLRYLWVISFFLGIILVIFSFITILPTSEFFSDITGDLGLEDFFDISFMYGMATIISSLIFICSIVYSETTEDIGSTGVSSAREFLSESESTTSEMVTYLEIIHQSNEDIIGQFKEALREDKFRPRVYEKLIKQYQDSNRSVKARMDKFRSKSSIISEKETARTLFDDVLGPEVTEKPTTTPSVPPTPPPTSPAPAFPPMPPKTTPSAPPMPSSPPPTSPAPPAPLATTEMTPDRSPQSPLDLIADARSTSIAELRGEMLKELRRLREIFKEE
ncbi:MAG: hypothetical protein ACXACU_13665 [Candidatus Hodarchaeales archaeon]